MQIPNNQRFSVSDLFKANIMSIKASKTSKLAAAPMKGGEQEEDGAFLLHTQTTKFIVCRRKALPYGTNVYQTTHHHHIEHRPHTPHRATYLQMSTQTSCHIISHRKLGNGVLFLPRQSFNQQLDHVNQSTQNIKDSGANGG